MGYSPLVKDLWGRQVFTVKSAPTNYVQGVATPILTVSGGPVLILSIIEYADTIIAAATDTQVLVGALGMDAGAIIIAAAAAGMTVVSPLRITVAKVVMAINTPIPSLLGFPVTGARGVVAAPGQIINVTFTTADMGAGELYSLIAMYRKLTPEALIS